MAGRRRCLERPAVKLLAVRTRRDTRVVGGDGALCLQFRQLPLQRGRDFFRGDRARPVRPGAGNFRVIRGLLRPPLDRLDEGTTFACALRRQRHLRQRLVDQERRRHEPAGARRLHPTELAIELLRIGLQPREIRFGVGRVVDAMLAVQEARDVEIGADVLDDDVGRVAPAANRDVAVRQREAFKRRGIGAAHDLHAGAHRHATGRSR